MHLNYKCRSMCALALPTCTRVHVIHVYAIYIVCPFSPWKLPFALLPEHLELSIVEFKFQLCINR